MIDFLCGDAPRPGRTTSRAWRTRTWSYQRGNRGSIIRSASGPWHPHLGSAHRARSSSAQPVQGNRRSAVGDDVGPLRPV